MSPPRLSRYTAANAGLWAVSFTVMTGRVVLLQPLPHPAEMALRRLLVSALAFLLCEGVWRALRTLHERPLAIQAAAALGVSVAGAAAYGLINHAVFYSVAARLPPPPGLADVVFLGSMQVWVFLAFSAIVLALARQEPKPATAWEREIWVRDRRERIAVPVHRIERVHAERDYVRLVADGRSHLLHQPLGAFLKRLDPERFLQVHRGAVVRIDAISALRRGPGGQVSVVLASGEAVRVSRRHLPRVLALTAARPEAAFRMPAPSP